jgi:ribosomal protein S18 acetylase RimI-like enzyme
MGTIRIVDVTDVAAFDRIPPCADPRFDHRTCDYWEDADRGSKSSRPSWLKPAAEPRDKPASPARSQPSNPFLADLQERGPGFNPFTTERPANPFLTPGDDDSPAIDNPFVPKPVERATVGTEAPRKLQLLGRGLDVAGSYAKVLLDDDLPAAYAQFGPLTAYPRAQRTRDLYPALPESPLPAVITCIATTAGARGAGLARRLVDAICADLATRGFSAVETYPEIGADPEATSAATPEFWESLDFARAIADERFPVMRRELV